MNKSNNESQHEPVYGRSDAIIPTEFKYALGFVAAQETKRLKNEVGVMNNGRRCVRKELVIQTLRAQLIKNGILKDEHLVVAGRQERWLKAMEFALAEADKVGYFIKNGGVWTTTDEFDKTEANMTAKSFMSEVLGRLEKLKEEAIQDETEIDEHLRRLGFVISEFGPDVDGIIEILRLAAKGKVRIIHEIEDPAASPL